MNQFISAVNDVREACRHSQLWLWTGVQDIKLRYRRSVLGPWWLTISTGILVAAMGFLYAGIFKSALADYLPYFAVGQVFWLFFSGQINESATAFTQFSSILQQTKIPLSSCVLRLMVRNIIVLLHNLLIIVLVLLIFGAHFTWNLIYFIPALFIFSIFLLSISFIVGILCTRFRDFAQIVSSVLQILFFLSPIFWKTDILEHSARIFIVKLNPVYYLIEIIRQPLFGSNPPLEIWTGAIFFLLAAVSFSVILFSKYRTRITYWL